MLLNLHVKNLALIEEEEISFHDGLNILTGETGAGKSILIGSVNLALGAKADKALIRTGAEYALIEMTFGIDNERQRERILEMELPISEEDTILVKRRIYPGRSTCSVEGETVALGQMREIAELLIDVYGQRENQRLLRRENQLGIIDEYAGDAQVARLAAVRDRYHAYTALSEAWSQGDLDESARQREIDLLTYEVNEIEAAAIGDGEDEALESEYRRMSNFRRISEAAGEAGTLCGADGGDADAASQIGRALRALNQVQGLDEGLDAIAAQLSDIDSLLTEYNRALSDYMNELSYDPARFQEVEERLNLINHLKDKYGAGIEQIRGAAAERQARLDALTDYAASRERLAADLARARQDLLEACEDLSQARRTAAEEFSSRMVSALQELNFPQVAFSVHVEPDESHVTAHGYDEVAYRISMNPGEAMRPLELIASGGELSRIMLAMKTVFAGKDEIHSYIFDEIDSGISGQTAWKVAERLGRLAQDHQILCITHLPQIAAMADVHYEIAKDTDGVRTQTHITPLSEEASIRELARLLGTTTINEQALENARQLRAEAARFKAGQ